MMKKSFNPNVKRAHTHVCVGVLRRGMSEMKQIAKPEEPFSSIEPRI